MLASPAEDAAEIVRRLGRRGLGRGQVRRHPGPAPQARAGRPPVQPRPARRQRPVPRGRRGGARRCPGTASSTARSWASRTASSCPSSASRPGSAGSARRPPSWPTSRSSTSPSTPWPWAAATTSWGRGPSSRSCACPLRERRARLDALDLPRRRASCARTWPWPADEDALEAAFAEARARRNEGLMVKDPDSGYSPGRRGLGWLKMKKALATIDCVVVGVEVGHGKRHGVLSDYTFAVRDEATDKLVNIGKAYSGLTDAEIAEMTALVRGPHDRPVRPLSPGRADGRRRDRLRRHRPQPAPRFRVQPALPAHPRPAAGQDGRRDRHGGDASPRCSRDCSTGRSCW